MSRIVLNLYFLKFLLCMHKILKNMRNAFYNSVAGKMDDPHKNKKNQPKGIDHNICICSGLRGYVYYMTHYVHCDICGDW